jgi:6-phosphogluconate dehydrogenase
MQLGMIGLGRMGANLVRRLTKDGHTCVVYDRNRAAVKKLAGRGGQGAASLDEFISKLPKPRAAWVMVPAGVAGETVEELASRMEAGDIIIDGGNTYYRDDLERAKALKSRGIHYVDCCTSGGVFGLERGFCLMIGGEGKTVKHLDPIFSSIAPGNQGSTPHPGLDRHLRSRRAGLPALRPDWCRTLRENGP